MDHLILRGVKCQCTKCSIWTVKLDLSVWQKCGSNALERIACFLVHANALAHHVPRREVSSVTPRSRLGCRCPMRRWLSMHYWGHLQVAVHSTDAMLFRQWLMTRFPTAIGSPDFSRAAKIIVQESLICWCGSSPLCHFIYAFIER